MSQCVCALCSARTNYIKKKPSKPEALKSLGVARSPSRAAPPNHTKCECCAGSFIHFRFGLPESWHWKCAYFSLQTREHCSFVCVAFTTFCMSICIDIFGQCKNPWLHFLMKVYSFWPYCVLQKRFLKLNIAFFLPLARDVHRNMCKDIVSSQGTQLLRRDLRNFSTLWIGIQICTDLAGSPRKGEIQPWLDLWCFCCGKRWTIHYKLS